MSTMPSSSTLSMVTRYFVPVIVPIFSQRFLTAGCSTLVVTMCRRSGAARRADRIAVESLSVPQLVKIISSESQPIKLATSLRAFFRAPPTCPPKVCMLDGLP